MSGRFATPTVESVQTSIPKRICLLRLSAIGDAIHALALVNGLRRRYPDAHLSWILDPVPYQAVRHQSTVDRFIVFDLGSGLEGWRRLARELRREEFDLLLVPQVSFRSSLVSTLVRAEVKLGFDWSRSRELHWLFMNRHLPRGRVAHAQDQFLEFLPALGLEGYVPEWNLEFTDEELEESERWFAAIDRPVLAMVLASSRPEKDWTPEGYAQVADAADRDLGLQPMLVGGPSRRERKMADAILARTRSRPIVALDRPVRTTFWKLRGSRVVVSPDTGPLHAAVAMNRPVIGLYGYSDPRRTGPYKLFQDLLVDHHRADPETPISRSTRPGRMDGITAVEVLEKIRLALQRYP